MSKRDLEGYKSLYADTLDALDEKCGELAALRAENERLREEVKAWCQRVSGMNYQCEEATALGVWDKCPDYGRCPHVIGERCDATLAALEADE